MRVGLGTVHVMFDVIVLADPFGPDKFMHVTGSAFLVAVACRSRIGVARAVLWVLVLGVAIELVQGLTGMAGVTAPSPIGGDVELADLTADLVGAVTGALASMGAPRRRARSGAGALLGGFDEQPGLVT